MCAGVGPLSGREHSPNPSSLLLQQTVLVHYDPKQVPSDVLVLAELILLVEHLLDTAPVMAQEVRTWTRRDPLLS